MRLLLVEDDPMVGRLLKTALGEAGYSVELCEDAESAELALDTQAFGVAVLDIGLPGKSGLDLLKSMRRAKLEVPVLILTARFAPPDRVLGLDLGADDYMVKPFDLDELLARLRSIIRRGQGRANRCLKPVWTEGRFPVAAQPVVIGRRSNRLESKAGVGGESACHSSRSSCAGLTRSARREGIQVAASPTSVKPQGSYNRSQ